MVVVFESAGSHVFDLGHIRRQGGEELLGLLLRQAGIDESLDWRVQVQKKLLCNGETPAVRVVGSPKKWAVYLKIKPGDNDSCHYCSLLMPDGLQGPQVYGLLKGVEETFDRNWRNHAVDKRTSKPTGPGEAGLKDWTADCPGNGAVPAAGGGHEAPGAAPETPPRKGTVRGWVGDHERTRLLLLAIHEINQEGYYSNDHFVELLRQKLGWEGANRSEVGGVFTSLVRKDYVIRKFRGSRHFGYELSEEGGALIADLLGPAASSPAPASLPVSRPAADPVQVIRSFGPVAEQFVAAKSRLEQIAGREAELTAELESLRKERADICRFLEDDAVQGLIAELLQLRPVK